MDSFLYDGAPAAGYLLAYYPHALVFEPQYSDREDLPKKLTVINRYRYSESDTLTLEKLPDQLLSEKMISVRKPHSFGCAISIRALSSAR